MANLRRQFAAVERLLGEVKQALERRLAEQSVSPSVMRAVELAIPPINAQVAVLQQAQSLSRWTPADTRVIVAQLHADLRLLQRTLAGDITLGDATNN